MPHENFECSKTELAKLEDTIADNCELLICSGSYEERCLSIPLSLNPKTQRSVLILKNATVPGKGSEHVNKVQQHFEGKAEVVETKKGIAIHNADIISKAIKIQIDKGISSICVDVTTMTHETVLIVFKILNFVLEEKNLTITYLYNPAEAYDPDTPDIEKWLSKGLASVSSVLGFSGNLLPSQKNHLVVLVGFEVNRASGLIDVFEPATMSFGYGDNSSFCNGLQNVNKQKHKKLSVRYPSAEHFEFSPSNAYLVRDQILEQANNHPDKNLIVAPMNTKISTLGCALAACVNKDIQICYASAVTYNVDNYSKPSKDCMIFKCNVDR